MKTSFIIRIIIFCIFIIGCASKANNTTVRFGLNSCFRLFDNERVVAADKDVELFYTEYSALPQVSMAFNRVIRAQQSEYIFINLITDKKMTEIHNLVEKTNPQQFTHSTLGVGPVVEYTSMIAEKNGYWNYYLFYLDKAIGQPFAIIVCSKNKETIEHYFHSKDLITKRLNCEALPD